MAYLHDLDPFAIQLNWGPLENLFGNDFGIRWYGLAYLAGFICTYFMVKWMSENRWVEIPPEKVGDFITVGAIGAMVGGRLGYCLFYSPDLLTSISSQFPYWGVLEVHKGGMASHGGILGVLLACLWFGNRHRISKMQLVDLTSLMGGVGIFFGRMANFVNGELFGRACEKGCRWAVQFPTEIEYWAGYHVEKLKSLAPAVETLKDFPGRPPGLNGEHWLEWVERYRFAGPSRAYVQNVLNQIPLSVQNGNEELKQALALVLTPRYPSQIYQGFMEGLFVFVVCFLVWKSPRKPGVITGVFGITYSLMRILGEQYRMPDAHIGFEFLGLTRGQWLSFGLLALAIVIFIAAVRSPAKLCGGWGQKFQ